MRISLPRHQLESVGR